LNNHDIKNVTIELETKENNKRKEWHWCAIIAKILMGLCLYKNYKLPKYYSNSKVFKTMCAKVGWIMDDDGNTIHKASPII
jgi:hypothetical protein